MIIFYRPNGKKIKRVDSFIYLGSLFTADSKSEKDVERRIQLANIAVGRINSLLWSPRVTKAKKSRLIMCFVYPVISYACETWALKVTTKKILDVIWMKWMRRCAGVSIADKIRNVDILEDLNQIPLS